MSDYNILNSQDLINVNGGAAKIAQSLFLGIIGACVFVASIIYGYIHPKACSK